MDAPARAGEYHRLVHDREGSGSGGTIVQYWHDRDVPGEVAEWIATFRDRNPDLRHLLFDEAGATQFISEHLTKREVDAFRACAVPAMQADYFRYCAVLGLGGVYVDVGFRCRRALRELTATVGGGMLFSKPGGEAGRGPLVNGFFVFRAPHHPLLRLALSVATANIERRAADMVNQVTGPWVFSSLAAIHRAGSLEAAADLVTGERGRRLADSVSTAIDSYEQVARAFRDVRIAPFDEAQRWISRPDGPRRYKESETRWSSWPTHGGTIFRKADHPSAGSG